MGRIPPGTRLGQAQRGERRTREAFRPAKVRRAWRRPQETGQVRLSLVRRRREGLPKIPTSFRAPQVRKNQNPTCLRAAFQGSGTRNSDFHSCGEAPFNGSGAAGRTGAKAALLDKPHMRQRRGFHTSNPDIKLQGLVSGRKKRLQNVAGKCQCPKTGTGLRRHGGSGDPWENARTHVGTARGAASPLHEIKSEFQGNTPLTCARNRVGIRGRPARRRIGFPPENAEAGARNEVGIGGRPARSQVGIRREGVASRSPCHKLRLKREALTRRRRALRRAGLCGKRRGTAGRPQCGGAPAGSQSPKNGPGGGLCSGGERRAFKK